MTEISLDTQVVLEAKYKAAVAQAVLESMYKVNKDSQGLNNLLAAAALRAATDATRILNSNDQWICDAIELQSIANELEGKND